MISNKFGGHDIQLSLGTPDWYGLGPVSVRPDLQGRGIGQALIREGLAQLKSLGARGCALVGDPNYYIRFGFANIPGLIHEGIPQDVFLALPFDGGRPQGTVTFHEGFRAEGC